MSCSLAGANRRIATHASDEKSTATTGKDRGSLDAPVHARRLKTLRGLTPYAFVFQVWTKDQDDSN